MKKTLVAVLAIATISTVSTLIDNNLAVLFFSMFWLFLGYSIIMLFFKKQERGISLQIFLLFYLIYYIYTLIVTQLYIHNPRIDYFISVDSFKFYSNTDDLLSHYKSLGSMYQNIEGNFLLSESTLFYYISGTIGFVANIMGSNSYFIQQMVIVFMTAFIPVFLFRIARLYFYNYRAKQIAISFGLFTHIFAYSATLLRDIHIAFFFSIAFYLLLTKKTFKNLFFLVLIGGAIFLLRLEHGIFFTGIIGFYLLILLKEQWNNPVKLMAVMVIMLASVVVVLVKINLLNLYVSLTNTTSRYATLSAESAEQSGLGLALLKLPHGPREIARVAFSQITPFPAYAGFNTSFGVFKIMVFPLVIAAGYWFMNWWILIYGLSKRKYRQLIPFDLKVAFFTAMLLIVAASMGSGDFRRLMCVYPIVYLVGALFYFSMPKTKKRNWLKYGLVLYVGLHVVYATLKF